MIRFVSLFLIQHIYDVTEKATAAVLKDDSQNVDLDLFTLIMYTTALLYMEVSSLYKSVMKNLDTDADMFIHPVHCLVIRYSVLY